MKACSTTSPFPDLPWWRHRSPSRHVAGVSSCVASIFGNFSGYGGSTVGDQPLDATKKFPILTWFSFPAQPWRSRTCWSSCGPADPTQSGSSNWRNWKKPPNGLFWTRSDRIDRKQVWQVFLPEFSEVKLEWDATGNQMKNSNSANFLMILIEHDDFKHFCLNWEF